MYIHFYLKCNKPLDNWNTKCNFQKGLQREVKAVLDEELMHNNAIWKITDVFTVFSGNLWTEAPYHIWLETVFQFLRFKFVSGANVTITQSC